MTNPTARAEAIAPNAAAPALGRFRWPFSPPAWASASAAASSPTGAPSSASPAPSSAQITGAGFTGFCFGIIIGGADRRQDRLRQARHRRVRVPRAVGVRHVRRLARPGQDDGLQLPVLGHVHLRHRERHARGGRQSARRHALSLQPHALPEHPARELAGRPRARRRDRLGARRAVRLALEVAARPLPAADVLVRVDVLRPAACRSRRRRRRACQLGEMFKDVGLARRARRLLPARACSSTARWALPTTWAYVDWTALGALAHCCRGRRSRTSRSARSCCSCCSSRTCSSARSSSAPTAGFRTSRATS